MVQFKSAVLLMAVGMLTSTGVLWADNAAPAATPAPATTAVAKPKAAKVDSPAVASMKAAIALAEAGKTDEAVAAYEKMGVLKSKKMEAWRLNNEGLAYLTAKEPALDKALPLFEKATATDDSNYVAWNNLGSVYEQTGALDKAKDAYQKSIDAAKAVNASSAKAEGNLAALQPRLDKLAAKQAKMDAKNGKKPDAKVTPAATPKAGDDDSK